MYSFSMFAFSISPRLSFIRFESSIVFCFFGLNCFQCCVSLSYFLVFGETVSSAPQPTQTSLPVVCRITPSVRVDYGSRFAQMYYREGNVPSHTDPLSPNLHVNLPAVNTCPDCVSVSFCLQGQPGTRGFPGFPVSLRPLVYLSSYKNTSHTLKTQLYIFVEL